VLSCGKYTVYVPVVLSAERVDGACFAADARLTPVLGPLQTVCRQQQVVVETVQQHRTLVQRTVQTHTHTHLQCRMSSVSLLFI